jgi:hypothetical protein
VIKNLYDVKVDIITHCVNYAAGVVKELTKSFQPLLQLITEGLLIKGLIYNSLRKINLNFREIYNDFGVFY